MVLLSMSMMTVQGLGGRVGVVVFMFPGPWVGSLTAVGELAQRKRPPMQTMV